MAMKVEPLFDRILVQRVEAASVTPGGLFIPDNAKERPAEGIVEAVGPGRIDERGNLVAMSIRPGDRILFGRYTGSEVKIDGEDYVVMREDEIIARLLETVH